MQRGIFQWARCLQLEFNSRMGRPFLLGLGTKVLYGRHMISNLADLESALEVGTARRAQVSCGAETVYYPTVSDFPLRFSTTSFGISSSSYFPRLMISDVFPR